MSSQAQSDSASAASNNESSAAATAGSRTMSDLDFQDYDSSSSSLFAEEWPPVLSNPYGITAADMHRLNDQFGESNSRLLTMHRQRRE